ncbi:hypothetical protein ENBRE01_3513 [Enteropsectra breve]|nr:hypothetical protein ENBRE01_3513 [Enteropsectra breve]
MSRGKKLTNEEKGKILAYVDLGLSKSEISRRIRRSRTVIHNFIAHQDFYGDEHSSGRPGKLSKRQKRAIIKLE